MSFTLNMFKNRGHRNDLEAGTQIQEIIFGVEGAGRRKRKKPESKFQRDTKIVFKTFCERTSLHGLQYLGPGGHISFKIFWMFIAMVAIGTGYYLVSKVYSKWEETPVMITISSKPKEIYSLPFPAVTICPGNGQLARAAKHLLDPRGPNQGEAKKELDRLCHRNQTSNVTDISLFTSCEDLMLGARLLVVGTRHVSVPTYVQQTTVVYADYVYNTPSYLCCTFNALSLEKMYRNLNTSVVKENDSGYRPTERDLNINGDGLILPTGIGVSHAFTYELELDIGCNPEYLKFRVAIHDPKEAPDLLADGLIVKPNSEIFYSVKPEVTEASRDLGDLHLQYRGCHLDNENILRFYKHYTKRNCELDCLANITLDKCKCIPEYLPAINGFQSCTVADNGYHCYREEFNSFESGKKKSCNCLYPCNDINYEVSTVYVPEVTKTPTIKFNVFFKDSIFFPYFRSELQGLSDFLANCGGLLGLCMGFSVVSMIELIYFCTVGVWKGIAALR